MSDNPKQGTPVRIGRWSVAPDGSRRELSPLADAATDDAHGSNALDSDGSPADDGNPIFDLRGPFGEGVSVVNSDFNAFIFSDPPPDVRPDADRNDERNGDGTDDRDDWRGDRERDNAENGPHSHRAAR